MKEVMTKKEAYAKVFGGTGTFSEWAYEQHKDHIKDAMLEEGYMYNKGDFEPIERHSEVVGPRPEVDLRPKPPELTDKEIARGVRLRWTGKRYVRFMRK